MTLSIMELQGVVVRYTTRKSFFRHEGFTALNNLSFEILQGETLGVIGVNGCGKSTLLRVLANIYGIDSGLIKWHCHQVSILTLSLGFDPELSGWDNAVLSGMLLGARKTEVLDQMGKIIEFSELEQFIYKPIKTYSTGMRARLGFSVAINMRSELMLLDEVMSVGDGKFRKKAEVAMMNRIQSNQTVVLVSHALKQVNKLCDRVLWLDQGSIRMLDSTNKVLPEYRAFLQNGN